jgi:hypothetical protein
MPRRRRTTSNSLIKKGTILKFFFRREEEAGDNKLVCFSHKPGCIGTQNQGVEVKLSTGTLWFAHDLAT